MPAYTTISCSFDKRDRSGLVRAFYDAFFVDDVAFAGVFAWGCDADLTLDEIVEWNQTKLDADFILGYSQDVSHDYRQVLVAVEPFSECRLILSNSESEIAFRCIVPEVEINPSNAERIEQACRRVWEQLPFQVVESYGELGADVGRTAIQSGHPPSADLFAMIDYDCAKMDYAARFNIERLPRGYLLKPNDA